jgi:FMN phosphatase YigB (HAD superfamily)
MKIAIDLDDVVLDFMPSVVEAFYKEYGVRPDYDGAPWGAKAIEFGKHEMFLESGYSSWWGWLCDREWLWATFPAIPGAIGGIKRLRHAGHSVECVTSKPEWAEHSVWKWLGKWRPAFNRVTVVAHGQRKVDFTDADVVVDDKLETCEDFINDGRAAIWFNRERTSIPRVEKLSSGPRVAWHWEHVIEHVAELQGDACTPRALIQD